MTRFDAAIVGGGLHGASAALHLSLRGLRVAVVEKDWAGRHASGVNAGGVRTLLRDPAEIPLALASREIWHRIGDHVGDDCGYHTVGQVAVAETEDDLRRLEARAAHVGKLGFRHEELVDRAELRRLVPAIDGRCVGGLAVRGDGYASPYHTTVAFKRRAESGGARFFEGVRVLGLERVGGRWRLTTSDGPVEAPVLVNCAGAWGDQVAAWTGDRVPLECFLPMMMVTARVARLVDPVVIGVGRPLSLKQGRNGTLLIGGGRPAGGRREGGYRLDFAGLKRSADTVRDLFPALGAVPVVRCWAGKEGRTPDEIPVIGPARSAAGVFHAFGFSGHGFQLGPIVGRIVAELAVDGRTAFPIAPFAVDRFR